MSTTPNMSLVLPVDHASTDLWGAILNTVFPLIDSHDHTTGKGVQIQAAALKINADVAWSFGGVNYAITALSACDFTPVAAASVTAYSSALFANSSDANNLYYRNSAGTNVKITSGSTLNVSIVGGIGGDYASVGALLSFDDATDSYWLQQQGGPRPWARVRVGDVDIYETAASITNRIRVQSPAALVASYALTLPPALPGSTLALQVSSAGVMSLSNTIAAITTTTLSSSTLAISTPAVVFLPAAIAAADFTGGVAPTLVTGSWALSTSTTRLTFPVALDVSGSITGWSIQVRKTSTTGTITARMYKMDPFSGTETALGVAQTNGVSNPGYVSIGESGTSFAFAGSEAFYIVIIGGGVTGDFVLSASVLRTRA